MPLNVELLRKVQRHIKEEPKRLRMNNWLVIRQPGEHIYMDTGYIIMPSCGTVGCIAGWTWFLAQNPEELEYKLAQMSKDSKGRTSSLEVEAEKLLDIEDTKIPFCLFYLDTWPSLFSDKWYDLDIDNIQGHADVVCEVIDSFIERYASPTVL